MTRPRRPALHFPEGTEKEAVTGGGCAGDHGGDLIGSHVGGDSRGCAGEGERSGRWRCVSGHAYGHTRWIGLAVQGVVMGGGIRGDGH